MTTNNDATDKITGSSSHKEEDNNNNDDVITNEATAAATATTIIPDLRLEDITDGANDRGIPCVMFIEDITKFSSSFSPVASAELMIGAFTQLHTKYRTSEQNIKQKQDHLKQKLPELEKSLNLVRSLLKKKEDGIENGIVRYNLADQIYTNAEVDYTVGTVHLWLGANVMLEYTYEEAIHFLNSKHIKAEIELNNTIEDLSYVRDQIVTCEVNMSRIFNWDVRRKRMETAAAAAAAITSSTANITVK